MFDLNIFWCYSNSFNHVNLIQIDEILVIVHSFSAMRLHVYSDSTEADFFFCLFLNNIRSPIEITTLLKIIIFYRVNWCILSVCVGCFLESLSKIFTKDIVLSFLLMIWVKVIYLILMCMYVWCVCVYVCIVCSYVCVLWFCLHVC